MPKPKTVTATVELDAIQEVRRVGELMSNVLFGMRQYEMDQHTRQSYDQLYRQWNLASAVLHGQSQLAATTAPPKRPTTRRAKSA